MTVPGVVLIGARGYGLRHRANVERLVAVGACALTAVIDPMLDAAADGGTPVVPDLASARALGPVDVVIVAAPIAAHLPLALASLEAGADVLLEKPPVTTRGDLHLLLDAERRTGHAVQVGFQSLGSHALTAFRDGSVVGRVRSAAAAATWRRDAEYWDRSAWAGRRRVDGVDVLDGAVTNPLAHAVATALALVGCRTAADVARVEVELYRANPIEGDDTSAVRVTTRAGLVATASLTLCAAEETLPTVRVRGTEGHATLSYTLDDVAVGDAAADGAVQHHGRTDLLENLLDHRRSGAPLLVPLASTGAFIEVLEAVRTAEPVQIDHPWVTWLGDGPDRHPVVADVEAIVDRAADARALFSEVGAPWAHRERDRVEHDLGVDGIPVASAVDGAGTIPTSSPRPYLHPVRTLAGTVLTAHHPGDHDWHGGLGIALPDVDGVNCWGGRTYVRGVGYVWRDDHGRAVVTGSGVTGDGLRQEVTWQDASDAALLVERRTLAWRRVDAATWQLDWSSAFQAPGDAPVRLGSPGSNGREGAGYGGLFWRFPPCADVDVRAGDARGEAEAHGSVAPSITWTAAFEGRRATVTLEALDHGDPWFVRVGEYPAIGSALAWSHPVVIAPGRPLVRSFRARIADVVR